MFGEFCRFPIVASIFLDGVEVHGKATPDVVDEDAVDVGVDEDADGKATTDDLEEEDKEAKDEFGIVASAESVIPMAVISSETWPTCWPTCWPACWPACWLA